MVLKFLKDPLAHFIVLGAVLFVLFAAFSSGQQAEVGPKKIIVDRAALLTFIQYRTKKFEPKMAAARLDNMSTEERQQLIDAYTREEALYREAKLLGLDQGDYIIKRRMIQKAEFITQGIAEAAVKVKASDLETYYRENSARYLQPGHITFTHVFFDADKRGMTQAKEMAGAALSRLRQNDAPFHMAPRHGDRFPYGVNFVERSREHVESQFGSDLTHKIFTRDMALDTWQGPFLSPYGAHVVMMAGIQVAHLPSLDEVRTRAKADFLSDRQKRLSETAIRAIVDGYEIELDLKPKTAADSAVRAQNN